MMPKMIRGALVMGAVMGAWASTLLGAMIPLPSGYARLEWIQSMGNQYIDSEYVFSAYDTFVVDCVVNFPQARTYPVLFGTRKGGSNTDHATSLFLASNSKTTPRLSYYRARANAASTEFTANQRVTITATEAGLSWASPDGSITGSIATEPKTHEGGFGTLMIFGMNNASTATTFTPDGNSPACVTLYSFTITSQDGVVRRSFIPCRRLDDNEAGLWDEVEGKFHANRGIGHLLGPDYEEVETLVDYVSATGTQAFNTGYLHAYDDTFIADFTAWFPQAKTYANIFGARNNGSNANNATSFFLNSGSTSVCKVGYTRAGGTNFNGGSGNFPTDRRLTLTCGPSVATWQTPDNKVNGSISVTPTKTEGGFNPIVIFGLNNTKTANGCALDGNSWAKADLYSFRIVKSDETVAHDYIPYRTMDGEVRLRDLVTGTSLANIGSGAFGFGCAYTTNDTTLCVHEGKLTDDLIGDWATVEKVGIHKVDATGVGSPFPPLTLSQGMLSFQDGVGKSYSITQTLTLKGGTCLALDVAENGCDVLSPAAVSLVDATAENPVVLKVTIDPAADLMREYTVITFGVTGSGTPSNIRVEGAQMRAEIRNGALLLIYDDPSVPVRATWVGNAESAVDSPQNWICENSLGEQLTGVLPTGLTRVVLPDGCVFNCPRGAAFACRSIAFPATLGGDCDWRGVAQPIDSTINLNGHKLYLSQLSGSGKLVDTVNEDYALVDYVSADGRQVVDTKYLFQAYDTFVLDFYPYLPQAKTFANAFGTRNNGNNANNSTSFFITTGNRDEVNTSYWRTGTNKKTTDFPVNQRLTMTCNETGASWVTADGEITGSSPVNGSKHDNGAFSLVIFGMNNGKTGSLAIDGNSWAKMDLYSFRIYSKNMKLMRNFQPAKRWSDGVYGLYETCTREFFPAASVSSAQLSGASVDNAVARPAGEVHLDVPEGTEVTVSTLALEGTLKLVKEGAGTLRFAKNDQFYFGGTDILEGTVRRAADGPGSYLGAAGDVTVYPDGILDFDGYGNQSLDRHVLAGGEIKSLANRSEQGYDWLQQVTLTTNSTVTCDGAGFVGASWAEATLEMNGHQLDLVTSGSKGFYLANLTVTGGGRLVARGGGELRLGNHNATGSTTYNIRAGTTTLEVRDVAFNVFCADVLVGGYTSEQPTANTTVTNGVLRVAQTFTPKTDVFYCRCQLQDGVCIDLSSRTTPLPAQTLKYAEDAASVWVHIGPRFVRSDEPVMAWDEIPAVRFKATPESKCVLIAKDDGLYVYRGFTIFVR